jgi:HD-GYP domain-containing protein (c-di-GMP phosphodiesterase class II)
MELIELRASDILIGQPLTVDCYDNHGHLLLRKGLIVASEKQLDFLIEHGLYAKPSAYADAAHQNGFQHAAKLPTPFGLLERIGARLQPLFAAACAGQVPPLVNFTAECMGAADQIITLCEADTDALLGAIHLDETLPYSIRHCLHRAVICERIGAHMGQPPEIRRQLVGAALTCDLSLYKIHDEMFGQQQALRQDQRDAIAHHPAASVKLLAAAGVTNAKWITAVLHHHELPNGKGYPRGLIKQDISEWGLIIKLADMYTAMIAPRRYRNHESSKSAMRTILLERGKSIDDGLAVHFIKALGVFPPGVFVRLQNGELAIVIHRGANPKAPTVMSVVGPRGAPFERPFQRKTDSRESEVLDVVERDPIVEIDLPKLWGYD